MIRVCVLRKEYSVREIKIMGHAMYDDYGKDIVCSAVSSIVTTSINGILALDKNSLTYSIVQDEMTITIKDEGGVTQTLIENMIALLKELAHQYKDNIEIK